MKEFVTFSNLEKKIFDQKLTNSKVIYGGSWFISGSISTKEILKYPFQRVEEIKEASFYCGKIYNNLIKQISENLNKKHKVTWTPRAWKILIGPWLSRCVESLYEKWKVIQQIEKNHPNAKILGKLDKNFIFLCVDNEDFSSKTKSNYWNEQIYLYLIKNFSSLEFYKEYKESNNGSFEKKYNYNFSLKYFFKKLISLSLRFFQKKTDGVIYNSYIDGIYNKIKLYIAVGQIPQFIIEPKINSKKIDNYINDISKENFVRNTLIENFNEEIFKKILSDLIPKMFPIMYLEGFDYLKKISTERKLPTNPKFILTSGPVTYKDESFKYWISTKVMKGTKLISMQHGGVYGTEYFDHSVPRHEFDISDLFLSWGWTHSNTNIKPVPSPLTINQSSKYNKKGKILFVFGDHRKHFSYFSTDGLWDMRSEIYCKNQINLLKNMPNHLASKIEIKLYPNDLKNKDSMGKKIDKEITNIKYKKISNTKNFMELLSGYKLTIFNYNSTSFLQTIGSQRPCMLLLDTDLMPFNKDAKKYFIFLKEAGVFHESNASLIKKIDEIEGDIFKWWNDKEVIEARQKFCNKYVRFEKNFIQIYKNMLNFT